MLAVLSSFFKRKDGLGWYGFSDRTIRSFSYSDFLHGIDGHTGQLWYFVSLYDVIVLEIVEHTSNYYVALIQLHITDHPNIEEVLCTIENVFSALRSMHDLKSEKFQAQTSMARHVC